MISPKISVIITTYNWPAALEKVLQGFMQQNNYDFEVIVADDGSREETTQLINRIKQQVKFQLKHVWHEDIGFRAAMIRNKAVAQAQGNYLIFIDGDCIPSSSFITTHKKLAEENWFVAGNRILLSEKFTAKIFKDNIALPQKKFFYWCKTRLLNRCNRLLPLIKLPAQWKMRKRKYLRWQGVKTCNLAMWKQDFINVNGFDEAYQGWGYEDSDLVIRLLRNKVFHKNGRFAVSVFHLWHLESDRSRKQENQQLLAGVLNGNYIAARAGVDQYCR
jgi:glycosyltransferase involved in cell wall biosynthesis